MLMNYHIGRLVLSSLSVGAFGTAGFWWCSFCRLKHNCSVHVVCGGSHGPINIKCFSNKICFKFEIRSKQRQNKLQLGKEKRV